MILSRRLKKVLEKYNQLNKLTFSNTEDWAYGLNLLATLRHRIRVVSLPLV